MQDILRVFLTRILSLGMLIVSALVIGLFPVDLRNASVITLFTVGVPTALLAIWARPGRQARESLQQTLARFVVPAAGVASFLGLLVAAIVLILAGDDAAAGVIPEADVEGIARTSVTAFLVGVGLLVLVFVEPPHPLLAVIEPVSPDRKPTWLAAILGVAFVGVLASPAFRAFFNLQPMGLREAVIVLLALGGWVALVWLSWRGRFMDRFLGMAPPAAPDGSPGSIAPPAASEPTIDDAGADGTRAS
jgi:cation-transporting ATPase E